MIPSPVTDTEFRFWEKVAFVGAGEDDCWEWRAGRTGDGYGAVKQHGRMDLAHRVAYRWCNGVEPHVVDHLCHNRACVNPGHLRSVTMRTNALENNDWFCATNAVKTHCPQGHEYTPENTKLKRQRRYAGWNRICRACEAAYMKQWRARRG